MAQQQKYNEETVTFSSETGEGAQTAHTVYEANTGNALGAKLGQIQTMCDVCGMALPIEKTMTFRGVVYGVPCKCSADVVSILGKEAADRHRPARTKPETEGKMKIGW